ncbi:MAG: hypothetical protein H0T76_27870 [Nannocystis sp.]|nr:hypothetical protein [Nannocystis sp.]MBA3550311.1 hypothetical protein [Nannocystis sp.]
MIIDPNNRLFDRVPDIFTSPYPGADVYADKAFETLMQRHQGKDQQTIGAAILSQAGAQAWNQATQMLWKTKATIAGDLLGDVWSKVAWVNPKTDAIAGILAEVPFALTTDPALLVGAMANVALDLALNAVSAIPVAGWIIGIVVGIGRALAGLFKGLLKDGSASPDERARLPWGRYNRDIDQEWVRTFIKIDAAGVDWTPMFAPPTDAIPWQLLDGVDQDDSKRMLGQVLAPFANKTVAYNGMYGCLPGTFRVAGLLQHRGRPQPPVEDLRFYNDGTIIQQYGDFTQTGDFFPALQQLAGTTWQQIAAGGPDAYKVDCMKLEKLWRDWFSALYTSAMEQGYGTYLLQYLAREVHGEWRLGASASGILSPAATDWEPVPLVTPGTFKDGALATPKSRTTCLYTDAMVNGARVTSGDMGRRWSRDAKTGEFIAPPRSSWAGREGHLCVPWPPGDLLLSKYRRADDAIITPAVRAVAQLQRSRLSRSLDCAYVRPIAVGDRPAYAAFADNPSLRDHCIDMRKRLLKHPGRMQVEYETVRQVDPEYADALRQAGVPTTAIQRAAAKMKFAGTAANEPLDPRQPPPVRPLPLQGGLPFDPNPDDGQAGRRWLGPAVLGGAALVTAISVAVGVTRSRRSSIHT